MAELPTYEQMAKRVAEKALDEFLYNGKSIREWMKIIAEQELKTGHWINHKDEHQCSRCHETVIADPNVWEEYSYDYCPNCGVKMESEG